MTLAQPLPGPELIVHLLKHSLVDKKLVPAAPAIAS